MTILAAMQSAAVRLIGRKPSVFFGASDTFELEITDLINEVAIDIAKYQDWQALVALHSIIGDGTTTDFDLPEDYDHMTQTAMVQDVTNWAWGYRHYLDINEFLYEAESGFTGALGGWIIYQNQIKFAPAPTGTARFPYITKNLALAANTAPKLAFTADSDCFRLPERLLTLGLVWRWRENKKLDATGDQEAFVKALDEYAAKDNGPTVIRRNSRRFGGNTAWPWPLGPSTYIDS